MMTFGFLKREGSQWQQAVIISFVDDVILNGMKFGYVTEHVHTNTHSIYTHMWFTYIYIYKMYVCIVVVGRIWAAENKSNPWTMSRFELHLKKMSSTQILEMFIFVFVFPTPMVHRCSLCFFPTGLFRHFKGPLLRGKQPVQPVGIEPCQMSWKLLISVNENWVEENFQVYVKQL